MAVIDPTTLAGGLAVALGGWVALRLGRLPSRKTLAAARRAGARLGLAPAPDARARWRGQVDGLVVELVPPGGWLRSRACVRILLGPRVPTGAVGGDAVQIVPWQWPLLGEAVATAPGPSGVRLGDRAFDRRFLSVGAPSRLYAALNVGVREGLLTLTRFGTVQLRRGRLELVFRPCRGDADELEDRVRATIHVARALAAGLSADADRRQRRLAKQVVDDPVPAVRAGALKALVAQAIDKGLALQVAWKAAEDDDPEVRLAAGRALGAGGRRVVEGVASDDDAPIAARLQAARALTDVGSHEVLAALLDPARPTLAAVAALALIAHGTTAGVDAVREALGRARGAGGESRAYVAGLRRALARASAGVKAGAGRGELAVVASEPWSSAPGGLSATPGLGAMSAVSARAPSPDAAPDSVAPPV